MAVVPRKRKHFTVYYVATTWSGGQDWVRVGRNKREAEDLDRARNAQVAAGTFRPGELTGAVTFRVYAAAWFEKRTNRNRDNDRTIVARHVLTMPEIATLPMRDIRPRHVLDIIDRLRAAAVLSEKSISLVMGLLRVMFRDAVIDETLSVSPYVVPRGKLTREGEKREPYGPEEAAALLSPIVGEREQVWNALAFLTGGRCGELCGLRWRDWNPTPQPLGALTIERQYDGGPTKTNRARVVPVHPFLATLLEAWRARWSLHYLRRPGPDDPIVPAVGTPPRHMTKSSAYKGWVRSCKAAGVTNRTVHSSRHTFITLALRAGAAEGTVLRLTHNPSGKIIDVYNHRAWAEFCAAVLGLELPILDAPLDASTGTPAIPPVDGSSSWTRSADPTENSEKPESGGSSGDHENTDGSEDGPRPEASLDASQAVAGPAAWALALAAERALLAPLRKTRGSAPARARRPA